MYLRIFFTCFTAYAMAQKAIIVGASTGIGREIAKTLAAHGYELGLCSRKTDLLTDLQKDLKTQSYVRYLDLKETDKIHDTLQQLIGDLGGLDLIVVNSGIWPEIAGNIMPPDKRFSLNGCATPSPSM